MLDALRVTLRGQTLVDLTTSVTPGDILTIMGPSGTGKSTLLAAIIGTLPAEFRQSGTITLAGRDIGTLPTRLRRVGILFQDDILFPHLSVGQNLAFALPPHQWAPFRAAVTGSRRRWPLPICPALPTVILPLSLAGKGHGWRCCAPSWPTPARCCWTSLFPVWTVTCAPKFAASFSTAPAPPGVPVILVTHEAEDARAAGGRVLSPLGKAAPI